MLGGDMRNNTLRSRLSCISILIGGMLLWWMWEAMMISYFAIPSKVFPFNTLEEFLTKSNKKVKSFIDFSVTFKLYVMFQWKIISIFHSIKIYHFSWLFTRERLQKVFFAIQKTRLSSKFGKRELNHTLMSQFTARWVLKPFCESCEDMLIEIV